MQTLEATFWIKFVGDTSACQRNTKSATGFTLIHFGKRLRREFTNRYFVLLEANVNNMHEIRIHIIKCTRIGCEMGIGVNLQQSSRTKEIKCQRRRLNEESSSKSFNLIFLCMCLCRESSLENKLLGTESDLCRQYTTSYACADVRTRPKTN